MIEQLFEMIQNVQSKQFARYINARQDLKNWIINETKQYDPKNLNESVFILIKSPPIICNNGKYPLFNTYEKGYFDGCGRGCKCMSEEKSNKLRSWHANLTDEEKQNLIDKAKETFIEHFGVDNPMKDKEVVERLKLTCIQRYGEDNPLKSEEIKDKIKATNLERYGVEKPLQSEEIRQKGEITTIQRYGKLMTHAREAAYKLYDGNPFEDEEIKDKRNKTMLSKYGTVHALQNSEIYQTMINKLKEKFNVENVMQRDLPIETLELFKYPEKFKEFAHNKSILVLSNELKCSTTLLYRYVQKYNIEGIKHNRSEMESDLMKWLDEHNIRYKHNDKIILKPKEIDILLLDFNIGIELNGITQHSEIKGGKDSNYHYEKYIKCKQAGIQLLQYWQDEYWIKNKIIKNKILHLCKKKIERIHTRKCQVMELNDSELERKFYEENHIQGFAEYRQKTISAIYNESLVACMSWANIKGRWELVRYATDINYIISGMFSKLLKSSIDMFDELKNTELVSFSDNRYSDGKLYELSGWTLSRQLSPDYCYTSNYYNRLNKQQFMLQKICGKFNISLSDAKETFGSDDLEWRLMKHFKYDRLWDCGKKRWIYRT